MDGVLAVHSQVGQGSVFTVMIPVRIVAVKAAEAQPVSRQVVGLAPHQSPCRILVVDDEWDNRQLLAKLLAPLGFELREASHGQEALELWRLWQPDLIWMDLRMPLMDGYEAARRIKTEVAPGQPPVILALSANGLEEDRGKLLAAGFDAFIRKPFREAEIFEAMERSLGLHYLYATVASCEAAPPSQQPATLAPEALAALPAEVLAGLERAVVETDPSLIAQSIAQVQSYNPELAEALAALANEFEYGRILTTIQTTRGHYA
jgi:CheY-like chemotaxis protein